MSKVKGTVENPTPRQVRERKVYEAEKAGPLEMVGGKTIMTAADRRNFFRKQAGWPQLRGAR